MGITKKYIYYVGCFNIKLAKIAAAAPLAPKVGVGLPVLLFYIWIKTAETRAPAK